MPQNIRVYCYINDTLPCSEVFYNLDRVSSPPMFSLLLISYIFQDCYIILAGLVGLVIILLVGIPLCITACCYCCCKYYKRRCSGYSEVSRTSSSDSSPDLEASRKHESKADRNQSTRSVSSQRQSKKTREKSTSPVPVPAVSPNLPDEDGCSRESIQMERRTSERTEQERKERSMYD